MTLDPNVLSALASMPEALASYIQSQTAAMTPMPITAAPVAPAVVAPPVVVAPAVTPTPSITITLSELVSERPKNGFYRFADGRPNLPKGFDSKTEAARLQKVYISNDWLAGRTKVWMEIHAE